MIVALCPLDNAFDTASNLAAIDRRLAEAARGGAALAVFPECGLTGFKARKDLTHAHLADALTQAQRLVARHGVATLLPSTELDRCSRPRNGARLFAADGTLRGEPMDWASEGPRAAAAGRAGIASFESFE